MIAVVLAAVLQAPVEDLVRALDDDSVDVRSDAEARLVARGAQARPALVAAREGGTEERRRRIDAILDRIARAERAAAAMGRPLLVTLEARNRPVREILTELAKQVPFPIESNWILDERPVTVSLDRVPVWRALEAISRAGGQVYYEIEEEKVVFRPGSSRPYPSFHSGPLSLFLTEVWRRVDDDDPEKQAVFIRPRICWNPASPPYSARFRIADIADDAGLDFGKFHEQGLGADHLGFGRGISTSPFEVLKTSSAATRLVRLKLEVSLDYALRWDGVTFEKPEGKRDFQGECPSFSATLHAFRPSFGDVEFDLRLFPRGARLGRGAFGEVWLQGKGGGSAFAFPQGAGEDTGGLRCSGRLERFYEIGASTIEEFTIRVPTEIHSERFVAEFKGLPLQAARD